MALPRGSSKLSCGATPKSVVGPVRSSAIDLVPNLAVEKKGIKLMHMDGLTRSSLQLCCGATKYAGMLELDRIEK
jgi:hypothetical protein